MIANERIKQVRLHRKLTSGELATKAGVSAAEISLIESKMRSPKTETLQRIAAALEVTTSYLLGEVNSNLRLEAALAKESLQIFLRDASPTAPERQGLIDIAEKSSAPESVKGWRDLVANLSIYNQFLRERS
jgi:transcriptional regulator with XRE-family HTH domain